MGCTPAPPKSDTGAARRRNAVRGVVADRPPSLPRARPPALSRWGSSSGRRRRRRCQSPDETSPRQRRLRRVTDEGRGRAPRVTRRAANGKAAAGAARAGAGRGGGRGVVDVGRAVGVRAPECVRAGGARACRWPRGPAWRNVRARQGARGRARVPSLGFGPRAAAPQGCRRAPGPEAARGSSWAQFARAGGAFNRRDARNASRLAVSPELAGPLLARVSPRPYAPLPRGALYLPHKFPASSRYTVPKPLPKPLTQERTVQKRCGTTKCPPRPDTQLLFEPPRV
uniref:Uncharacterized protein n=1 Tax=Rangifer tarandus platyrhynchus TaxID=3082113 RepID=A0ACB0EHB8_RANTA|nr:unnamed protein product [Rangifer tarandus platyrhynchus]